MKKIFAIFTLLASLFVSYSSAFADSADPDQLWKYYPMDTDNHWAYETLTDFIQAGILKGYTDEEGDTYVKPDQPITRAEFVTLLTRAADLTSRTQGQTFTDVNTKDWFYSAVQTAKSLGLISGVGDNKFAPNQYITRAELSVIIVRAFQSTVSFEGTAKPFTDISGHWAKSYIEDVSKAQIVNGYSNNTFQPNKNATRAEALTMLHSALHKESSNLPDDSNFVGLLKDADNANTAEEFNAMNYNKLIDDAGKYSEGFQYDLTIWSINLIKSMTDAGFTIDMKMSGQPSVTVLSKSDHYATVQLKGLTEDVTFSKDGSSTQQSEPVDDVFLFRKVNGEWKIYGAQNGYKRVFEAITQ
jgi:hypothetical protein